MACRRGCQLKCHGEDGRGRVCDDVRRLFETIQREPGEIERLARVPGDLTGKGHFPSPGLPTPASRGGEGDTGVPTTSREFTGH